MPHLSSFGAPYLKGIGARMPVKSVTVQKGYVMHWMVSICYSGGMTQEEDLVQVRAERKAWREIAYEKHQEVLLLLARLPGRKN